MSKRDKVVVAMSGGVDSSVAAGLLREQGYEVTGLFMRVGAGQPTPDEGNGSGRPHQGCCSATDAADARFVAGLLDIPFYTLNFREDFEGIIDDFAAEYERGRTPNPCVRCNDRLKFGRLVEYADAVGARLIATGHYARIGRRNGRRVLMRAVDRAKDQVYVLFGMERNVLDRVVFPLGAMTKDQVRDEARRLGLPVCDKPDSVDICFAPDGNYARVVRDRRPQAFRAGAVVDLAGRTVGRHAGVANFTIGQRRGLGIAAGVPIYVTGLHAASATVRVGPKTALLKRGLIADGVRFLADVPGELFRTLVKIRYHHEAAPATVCRNNGDEVRVVFDAPQTAVTPGQAAVFYDDEVVLGGGWIASSFDA